MSLQLMMCASPTDEVERPRYARLAMGVAILGIATGSSCALFLGILDLVTQWRWDYPWLLWFLPVSGAIIGAIYSRYGTGLESGNHVLIDQIREPTQGVPPKLGPLILLTTLLTHVCGGSAGREGTAVQMGGALAGAMGRLAGGLSPVEVRILLMAGIAAGFGGVFGTPVAGAIFALELAGLRRTGVPTLALSLFAAFMSDQVCTAWGIEHTHYVVSSLIPEGSGALLAPWNGKLVVLAIIGGIGFGLISRLLHAMTQACQAGLKRLSDSPVIRPLVGGCLVIAVTQILGTRDYLGIGVVSPDPGGVSLTAAFTPGGASAMSWFWKLLLTALTLGSGFKGGEATPLFFIGATFGHALAVATGCPPDLVASLGFAAVFIAATKTPLAGIVMSAELFGGETVLYHTIACVTAWMVSGSRGIYSEPHQVGQSAMGSGQWTTQEPYGTV